MIFFILPILCFAQKCVVDNKDYSFMKRTKDFFKYTGKQGNFDFTMNVCGTVDNNDNAITAKITPSGNVISIGKYSTQEPTVDKYGTGFKYTKGESPNGSKFSGRIYLACEKDKKEDTVSLIEGNFDQNEFAFKISGPSPCKASSAPSIYVVLAFVLLMIFI